MKHREKLLPSSSIYVAPSKIEGAGRGVFAAQNIQKDEVIEVCPVIVLPKENTSVLRTTELVNYYFMWGEELSHVAIALGYGALYNHLYEPNATYIKKTEERVIEFVAIAEISKDDEITVNYNFGNPDDKSPLWIKGIKPFEDK